MKTSSQTDLLSYAPTTIQRPPPPSGTSKWPWEMMVCPALKGWFWQAAARMGCWSFGSLTGTDRRFREVAEKKGVRSCHGQKKKKGKRLMFFLHDIVCSCSVWRSDGLKHTGWDHETWRRIDAIKSSRLTSWRVERGRGTTWFPHTSCSPFQKSSGEKVRFLWIHESNLND